jgi:hypothetical protein
MGVQSSTNNNNNKTLHPSLTLAFGIFAYLVYGFIIGGIVSLAYSVYHFDMLRIEEHYKDKGEQR